MSYEEVEVQFCKIMEIAEANLDAPIYAIEETLNEGLFALEYNPKGKFDYGLSQRILRWVELNWNWPKGDKDFIEGLVAIYMNMASYSEARTFFESKLETENRDFALEELKDTLVNDLPAT